MCASMIQPENILQLSIFNHICYIDSDEHRDLADLLIWTP